MPKSSIASDTPISLSRCIQTMVLCGSPIDALSVSSSSRYLGSSAWRCSTCWVSRSTRCWVNWRAATFTATGTMVRPRRCQALSWAQALCITHSPIARIRLLSSASGMKRIGGTSPSCGDCQRISASRPTMRPLRKATCGWK